MENNISPNTYSEVIFILKYIEPEYTLKVPKDIIDTFKKECNKEYLRELSADKTDPLERDYSKDALAIIAYLNLKYWCETNEEKKYYRDMYLKNK